VISDRRRSISLYLDIWKMEDAGLGGYSDWKESLEAAIDVCTSLESHLPKCEGSGGPNEPPVLRIPGLACANGVHRICARIFVGKKERKELIDFFARFLRRPSFFVSRRDITASNSEGGVSFRTAQLFANPPTPYNRNSRHNINNSTPSTQFLPFPPSASKSTTLP
jgi:hypothetical protein